MNLGSLWESIASNWLVILEVIGALAAIAGLPLAYLAIRKPRWRKYRCRGLPYERIFRRGDYGYDPQMFLKDVGSDDLAMRELSTWHAGGKPLLLRGVTGIGKSRLVTEFIGGLGIWHRLRTRVLMPTPHEFNERFPPFLPGRYIVFLNDLHEFRGSVPDDKLRFYAEDRRFKVVATIPTEKYDSDWSVLSGSIWRRVEVVKWETEEGRRLAEARKTVFRSDSFTGTPLSVIAPAAELKRSYELLACDRKAVLEALKIIKIHLGCFADYGLALSVPVRSGRFDESAFTDVIAKQRFWCKTEHSTAMLADGMEDFVDYDVTVEDAYTLEIVLTSEESALKNRPEYLFYLGNRFSRIGENQRALKCYDLSIKLDSRSPSPWLWRGSVLHDLGSIDDALYSYRQARNRFKMLGDQSGIATTLHQLANMESSKGNYDEAKKLYNEAKATFEKLGHQSGIAATIHQLANIQYLKGNYDEAKKLYNESLTIERKLGDQSGIPKTIHQLAMIEENKGNYDEAKKLYNESLTIKRKLEDQDGISKTLHQLGNLEYLKGNYDEARKLYNESLTIKRKLEDQDGIATTFGQLGRLAEDQKDLEAADKYYQQALQIFEKLGIKEYVKVAEKDLARVRKLKQKP